MKKFVILTLVCAQLAATTSNANPLLLALGAFGVFGTLSTTTFTLGYNKLAVKQNAVIGANQVLMAQSEEEVVSIIKNDGNLQMALAVLIQDGFNGNIIDAANEIVNSVNEK